MEHDHTGYPKLWGTVKVVWTGLGRDCPMCELEQKVKKLEAVMVQCPYHGEIEECPNDALLGHIEDRDTIIKGLRDTICFQCQMLAYKHSKKKPNPSCGNCMNGPIPHNPLQKALDRIKDLEAQLKQKEEAITHLKKELELDEKEWQSILQAIKDAPKPEFPDVSDPKYKTFDDYEDALEQYMIDTHDDGRTLPKPKEAPLIEKEWTPYADALKIKTGVKKPKEGKK